MRVMYDQVIQPSPLVVFSSIPISCPFDQISLSIDSQLTSDSFIGLVEDSKNEIYEQSNKPIIYYHPTYKPPNSRKEETEPSTLLGIDDQSSPIRSVVLHIQSPNCKNTFIRLPPFSSSNDQHPILGIKLPFLHLQIKPLNHTFLIEIGVRDQAGDQILIRCSTFQTEAKSYTSKKSINSSNQGKPNLIHLPITFPNSTEPENNAETRWCELLIPLEKLIPNKYKFTEFIKVHANIRLRRIFFTSDGKLEKYHNQSSINISNNNSLHSDINNITSQISSTHSIFRPELILFKAINKSTS